MEKRLLCALAVLENSPTYSPRVMGSLAGTYCKHQDWGSYGKNWGWRQTEDVKTCPRFQYRTEDHVNEG